MYISSNLHPSPQLYVAPQYTCDGSKVCEKCTTWCIHVARCAKLGGLNMGAITPFEHPKWCWIIFGKTHF